MRAHGNYGRLADGSVGAGLTRFGAENPTIALARVAWPKRVIV